MNILITGGSGFLGARLARELLHMSQFSLAGQTPQAITRITLTDIAPPPADLAKDPRIQFIGGDLNTLIAGQQVPPKETQLVFHLAAAVSAECEADFDLGMRSNLEATRALLEGCRALGNLGNRPTVVFASSVAVFGASPGGEPLPAVVDDNTLPRPQSSYGVQKFIGEQLMADYGRKGFIRARTTRLMTVSVRPGRPNGAASGFLSGMIREPLAGIRARVPVSADTQVALASPARAIEGMICAAQTSDTAWGPLTAVNLPALSVTVGQMAETLERVAGAAAAALLDWQPDPVISKVVTSWPGQFNAARANALGLTADSDFDTIVADYIRENSNAVRSTFN
jgi:D-erythronate 2-dehydrogenase